MSTSNRWRAGRNAHVVRKMRYCALRACGIPVRSTARVYQYGMVQENIGTFKISAKKAVQNDRLHNDSNWHGSRLADMGIPDTLGNECKASGDGR